MIKKVVNRKKIKRMENVIVYYNQDNNYIPDIILEKHVNRVLKFYNIKKYISQYWNRKIYLSVKFNAMFNKGAGFEIDQKGKSVQDPNPEPGDSG